jgi:mRNA interferase MazF
MKNGEIWLIELPNTLSSEQSGNHPAVLITEVDAGMAIIIPITSNIQAIKFKNTLTLSPSKINGLTKTSVALIFQLRAIDGKRFIKKQGTLENNTMKEINKMIKLMLKI